MVEEIDSSEAEDVCSFTCYYESKMPQGVGGASLAVTTVGGEFDKVEKSRRCALSTFWH